jgi:hypothetical protein
MALTEKESKVKFIMEEMFLPALHKLVREGNPVAYKKWGGNACRQTAFFGRELIANLLPEYKWSVWDGIFDDIVHGKPVQYNHAWIYGVSLDGSKRLLVDLARQHHERLFIEVTGNRYPKDHPSYLHMKEVRREKVDLDDWAQSPEFYTQLSSVQFITKLTELMTADRG